MSLVHTRTLHVSSEHLSCPCVACFSWLRLSPRIPADFDCYLLVNAADDWPPKDPNAHAALADDDDHVLQIPSNPWTYENGDLNPNLQPPSARRRVSGMMKRRTGRSSNGNAISAVPPYHPDYRPPGDDEGFSDSPPSVATSYEDEDEHPDQPRKRKLVRRGSEGFEVQAIDREAMLRQHVVNQVTEPGRYNVYMPDPPSESDDEDDQTPLASRVENWRAETASA